MNWRARAVFVSGTFRDMHEERDLLAARVFPALEEQLAQYYTTLERVDLRVGVETRGLVDDHAKQHLVLKVCLEDVKRCRPFLVVLIGDRYGWVPPIDRSRAATTEAGFDTTLEGKSVTALEIEFGLWGDPDQQTRSRIYFRQLDYTGMDEAHAIVFSDERAAVSSLVSDEDRALAANRAAALAASKQRLRDDPVLGPRCRNYPATWDRARSKVTGLGPFVSAVIEDLLPEMITEAREQLASARAGTLPTPLEQFVAERARGFKGRASLVDDLCAFATDSGESAVRGRVVTGPPGGGKSSVFARVFEELSGRDRAEFWLLGQAAGIDARSVSVGALLEDWVAILAAKLDIQNPLAAPVNGISSPRAAMAAGGDIQSRPAEAFADLLSRAAAKKRVVLLLDGLDRFERTPQAQHLTWLPARLPANVRLIATAIRGPETDTLARRPDVVVEPLAALTEDEALEIAQSVYGRYHRQPSVDAVRQLMDKHAPDGVPAHGNALWLVSALEELNLLDGDDFRRAEAGREGTDEDRLHAMVVGEARAMPGELETLYVRIFERAGRRVSDDPGQGAALTRAFIVAIALSQTGFRERDLAALIPDIASVLEPSAPKLTWDALSFASLRRALRAHLVRRGVDDRWDFHHRQARSAAERAYASDAEIRKQTHQLVANHLLGLDKTDPLHETESMVHLMQTSDLRQAAAFYGSDLTAGEARGATAALRALVLRGEVTLVSSLLAQPVDIPLRGRVGARFLFELDKALENGATLDEREALHYAAERMFGELAASDPSNADWQHGLAASHDRIGDVLTAQGNLPGALASFHASLALAERLAAADPGEADWQRGVAVSHNKLGDVLRAQGNLPGALAAVETSLAIAERLAAADAGDADWQRDLSVSHERIGDLRRAQGNLPGALAAFQASLALAERLAAADPGNAGRQRNLGVSHERIGDVRMAQGNLRGALAAVQASLAIAERLAAPDPSNAGWQRDLAASHIKLGEVLTALGNLPGALAAVQASLGIAERLAAADPGNAGWQRDLVVCHNRLGDVLTAQGNLPSALAAFQASLALAERLAAADPGNADWQRDLAVSHERIGEVRRAQGNLAGALAAVQTRLAIAERLAANDPGNADSQRELAVSHNKLGSVLMAQGHLPGALAAVQTSLAIRERLAAADPSNAGWQSDLAASYNKLGDVLRAQGNLQGALAAVQADLAIAQRLAAADPENANWQRDLAVSHNSLGDALTAQGNLSAALTSFQAGHRIFERLAAADPSNAGWQHDLSVSHGRIGDVLRAQGNRPGTLAAVQARLAIAERLAATDLGNVGWQRDLAVSHNKLGDVLRAQENLLGALAAFQASHRIFEWLAAADPGNAGGQRDLAVSYGRIGAVLVAQGNLPSALASFQADLVIAERLAAADPGNAGGQRDLAVSHDRLGDVLRAQGSLPGALAAFQASHRIVGRLAAADPGNVGWQRDLAVGHDKLGAVLTAQGNLPGGLAAVEASLAIRKRLAAADPGNAGRQRELAVSHDRLGDVLMAQGSLPGALAAFRASHRILERLATTDPAHAGWQRDFAVSNYKLATHSEQAQDPAAVDYWRRCHSVLRHMKASGMFLDPPLIQLFEQLDRTF
jgi:tetratricopeptide (TPR) repeat protein